MNFSDIRRTTLNTIFQRPQNYDLWKKGDLSFVNSISINSNGANVRIMVEDVNTFEIKAHLFGTLLTDSSKLSFQLFSVVDDDIVVELTLDEKDEISKNQLQLDVIIPSSFRFSDLYLCIKNGNLLIENGVNANQLDIISYYDNVKIYSSSRTLKIDAINSDLFLTVTAKCNIDLYLSTVNGNIKVVLNKNQFSKLEILSQNVKSKIRYIHKNPKKENFIATGLITTNNGNVTVK